MGLKKWILGNSIDELSAKIEDQAKKNIELQHNIICGESRYFLLEAEINKLQYQIDNPPTKNVGQRIRTEKGSGIVVGRRLEQSCQEGYFYQYNILKGTKYIYVSESEIL